MKNSLRTFGALLTLSLAPVHAQESPGRGVAIQVAWSQDQGEVHFEQRDEAKAFGFDEVAARVALSEANLDVRMGYVDELLGQLRHNREARQVVRAWLVAEGLHNNELAWTARLLQRELDQMESVIAFEILDPNMERFVLGDQRGALWSQGAADPKPESLVEEDLDVWMQSAKSRVNVFPSAPVASGELMSVELRIMPSMTRLRIMGTPHFAGTVEDANQPGPTQRWKTELQEFSGQDLASILNANPDLSSRLPFGLNQSKASPRVVLRTDVLGVHTRLLQVERGLELGLDANVGLEVVRIEPGTIAQLLGVDPGSVVLEVCGTTVEGTNGIANAIGGPVGSEVCVVWIDSFGERRERTWRNVMRDLGKHLDGVEGGLIRVELQEPVIEGEVIEGKLHPLVPVPVETGDTKEPR
ncbi:MAG: hypothetical protein ACI8Q9_002402 [Planctomycetota bacterium]|jgi:hypothetical protein